MQKQACEDKKISLAIREFSVRRFRSCKMYLDESKRIEVGEIINRSL